MFLLGFLAFSSMASADVPKRDSELFSLKKVWNTQLTFEKAQWESIEPKGGGGGLFGGRPGGPGGGPGRPGGPGGPGGGGPRGPGGPGGDFNPTRFMAPAWMTALDTDRDARVTRDEFMGTFQRWSTEWDTAKKGLLTVDDLREGMNKAMSGGMPGGGGGGGGIRLQGPEGKRNGLSAAAGIDFEYVHADLDFGGGRLTNVAVRYKGNGTYMTAGGSDKKSLKVDLNEFVKGQKLAGVSKVNFHNNVTDASWMNEPLSYWLYREAGVPAPRTSYSRIGITVPGVQTNRYLGLYSIVENLDDHWAEDRFGTKKGAIFKPVTPSLFQYLGEDWAKYQQTYDPKSDPTEKQKRRVMDFARLVTSADDTEFARRLPEFLDVDEFSRFMAVTVWLSTLDSILAIGQNYVVYLHPKTDQFQFLPWDLDHSFGNFMLQGTQQEREQLSIRQPWVGENRFLERVMKVQVVQEAYLARLKEFQGTIFQPARIQQQVDEVAAVLRDAVKEEDPEKLARFNQVVAGESVAPAGFGGGRPGGVRPGGPGGPGGGGRGPGGFPGFGQPVKPIKAFVPIRHQSVADQLAGKSEGQRIGGRGGPFGGRGPGGFGPGMFLAPAVLEQADADKDQKVTSTEMMALAGKWWSDWDSGKTGALNADQLANGLVKTFPMPPGLGGPEGGPRRQP